MDGRSRSRRLLTCEVRAMEDAFAAEDLAIRKKGGRRNLKAEAAREADRATKRDEVEQVEGSTVDG